MIKLNFNFNIILLFIIVIIIIYNSITIVDCFTNQLVTSSEIYIVYFIYINPDRNWKIILTDQMKDLNDSNILENNKLFVVISCDNEILISEAKYIVNLILNKFIHNIDFTIEEKNLFEYPGIKKVYDLALNNNDKLFIYFHSKGMVFHNNSDRNMIEEKLTKYTFKNWQNTISIFKNNLNINKIGLYPSDKGFIWYNFWWAKGSYISQLEKPIITNDRYYYEEWLSKIKNPSCNDSLSLILNESRRCYTYTEMNSHDFFSHL